MDRSILDGLARSEDMVALVSAEGEILDSNTSLEAALGYSRDELLQMLITDLDKNFPVLRSLALGVNQAPSSFPRRISAAFRPSTGEPVPVDVVATVAGDEETVLLVARKLSRPLRFISAILESLPIRFGVCNENLQLVKWTEFRTQEPARTIENLPSPDLKLLLPPEILERFVESLHQAIAEGHAAVEFPLNDDDKGALALLTRVDIDETPFVAFAIIDLSDRLRMERDLLESEERFRRFVETSFDGIQLIGANGEIIAWNSGQERITDLPAANAIGRPCWDVWGEYVPEEDRSPETLRRVEQMMRDTLDGVDESSLHRLDEYVIEKPGGERRTIEMVMFPIDVSSGRMLGTVTRDVTRSKVQEKMLMESTERLKQFAAQLADAQEAEKRRISAELHDRIGEGLTAIDLMLSAELERRGTRPERAADHVVRAIEQTRQTAERMRNLMSDMRPMVLDEYGISAALEWYVKKIGRQGETLILFEGDAEVPRLSGETEIGLFRIVQEATTNALKHAAPKQIRVQLEYLDSKLRVTVADDGCGFETDQARSSGERGWGLMLMMERAAAIGAHLEVGSSPGVGTRVLVEVPV